MRRHGTCGPGGEAAGPIAGSFRTADGSPLARLDPAREGALNSPSASLRLGRSPNDAVRSSTEGHRMSPSPLAEAPAPAVDDPASLLDRLLGNIELVVLGKPEAI